MRYSTVIHIDSDKRPAVYYSTAKTSEALNTEDFFKIGCIKNIYVEINATETLANTKIESFGFMLDECKKPNILQGLVVFLSPNDIGCYFSSDVYILYNGNILGGINRISINIDSENNIECQIELIENIETFMSIPQFPEYCKVNKKESLCSE